MSNGNFKFKHNIVMSIVFIILMLGTMTVSVYGTDENFENSLNAQGFPESYKVQLRILHERYPNCVFKGVKTQVDWNYALSKETEQGKSLVHINQPDSYKSVANGDYDFQKKYYIGKDSYQWVSASKEAVAYFLDPRNWLDERSIFMFEDLRYNPSYQSEEVVKKILSATSMPEAASSYFMKAAYQVYQGKEYSVSPTHLAARVRQEIGNSNFTISGEPFTYLGMSYRNLYNPYNIGATSGNEAAKRGLIYANGGYANQILSTTFNRPWDTLEKGIMGGALYIADGYINDGQNTLYLQKFNVNNGIPNVGTHQYMTNIMAPYGESSTVYNNYSTYGILNQPLTFTIPIFENMPLSPSIKPMVIGNNNCFLDSLAIEGYGLSADFDRFNNTYSLKTTIDKSVLSVNVLAKANSQEAKIEGNGKFILKDGQNIIKVKVTSSAGTVKDYLIYANRGPNGTLPKPGDGGQSEPTKDDTQLGIPTGLINNMTDGKTVKLSWNKVNGATGYRIRYKQSKYSKWYYTETTTNYLNKEMSTLGTEYDFRVRAFSIKNGKKTYGTAYSDILKAATFGKVLNFNGSLEDGEREIKLTWSEALGADSYDVYYKRSENTNWYKKTVSDNSFIKLMDAYNMKYDFKIVPTATYNNVKYVSNEESNIIVVETVLKKIANPENFQVLLSGNNIAKLSWEKVQGATGYRVRYKQSKYKKWYYLETQKTEIDKKLNTIGTVYDFKVRAFGKKDNKKIYSENYSNTIRIATFGKKGDITASLSPTKKSLRLTWSEVNGATGYRVYFKENDSKNWLRKDISTRQFTKIIKNGVSRYDFRVIPYKIYDEMKYFSNDVHGPLTYDVSKSKKI